MHWLNEAVAGLERPVSLGLKLELIPSYVTRPVGGDEPVERHGTTPGVSSEHDHDLVWSRSVELGVMFS
jgi:hypothetical protein